MIPEDCHIWHIYNHWTPDQYQLIDNDIWQWETMISTHYWNLIDTLYCRVQTNNDKNTVQACCNCLIRVIMLHLALKITLALNNKSTYSLFSNSIFNSCYGIVCCLKKANCSFYCDNRSFTRCMKTRGILFSRITSYRPCILCPMFGK